MAIADLRRLRRARRAPVKPDRLTFAAPFQPGRPAHTVVLGSAAVEWARQHDLADALTALHHAGCQRLLLTPAASVLVSALERFPGELWDCPGDEGAAMAALRRQALQQCAARTIHGVLVEVHDLGLLLLGPAGSGKSELALDLVRRGHRLVADDAVELQRLAAGLLIGQAPPLLRGFIEVRGLGVLDLGALLGPAALRERMRVDLVLTLGETVDLSPSARLGGDRHHRRIAGANLPLLRLPRRAGQSLATLAEIACLDHWLRLAGRRADRELDRRQRARLRGVGQ
jgi:Serine kinase of the HPr protein, regulates carbohydrate metabolism